MQLKSRSLKDIGHLTTIAMLIGLSAIGSMIKVFNTVAFDSMPGYFAALYLGGLPGAIVISLVHLLTSLTSGFPLGIPVHLYVAIQMAIFVAIFKFFYERYNPYVGILIGTLLNGPVAALLQVPIFGWGFFLGWVFPLSLASFVNIVLASLVYKGIGKIGGDSNNRKV